MGPAGGVEGLALEAVEVGDVGQLGPVERADRGDQDVGLVGVGLAVRRAELDDPSTTVCVVGRGAGLHAEADVGDAAAAGGTAG